MPQVEGRGTPGGLMIVVDAPTVNEVAANEILFGTPKRLVDQTLRICGNTLPTYWTCAIKVAMPPDKTATLAQWSPWRKSMQAEIERVQPKKILCLGPSALACVMNAVKVMPITKWHGRGMMHPSGAFVVSAYNPFKVVAMEHLFRDFSKAFWKVCHNDAPMPPPEMALYIPENMEELYSALNYLYTYEAISCDLETRPQLPGIEHDKDSFDPHAGKIMSFGFGAKMGPNAGYSVVIPERVLDIPEASDAVRNFFRSYTGVVALHNGKFDAKFIEAYCGRGWDDTAKIEDTMLMCYTLDERPFSASSSLGLKTQARIRYDAEDYAMSFSQYYANFFQGNKTAVEEAEKKMHLYHALDLFYTILLWYDLRDEAMEESAKLYDHLCQKILFPGSKVLTQIEYRGVLLDKEYTYDRSVETKQELADLVVELDEIAGDRKFDVYSPKQVRDFVESFGIHTKIRRRGGDAETDDPLGTRKDELLSILDEAPPDLAKAIPIILRIRQLSKLNITYFLSFLRRSQVTGRIHPDFRLAGTSTGRLSCAEPNLQNVPARIGALVRDCFIPTPGHIFVQMDYAQLELRMACLLAEDENLAKVFRDGIDIHMVVACELFDTTPEHITKNMRMMAKNIDFGILYGRGAKTIVEGPEMDKFVLDGGKRWTIPQANHFINKFRMSYPKLSTWMDKMASLGVKQQYVESPYFRRRRYPFIPNRQNVIGNIRRQSVNMPVQSASSDVCLMAMIELFHTLPSYAHVLFSVHDSILFEVEEDKLAMVAPFIKRTMENAHGLGDFCPFEVTAEKGYRWGQLKDFEVEHVG